MAANKESKKCSAVADKSGNSGINTKVHNKYDISDETYESIRQTFESFDPKGEHKMETKQLKFAIRALGFEPKKEGINRMIEQMDKNKTGFISYDDFVSLMAKRFTEKDTNEEIMKAFQLFDFNKSGNISFEDLKRVAKELGENLSDDELQEMITEADRDGDGLVSSQEFLRIMKKTCLY